MERLSFLTQLSCGPPDHPTWQELAGLLEPIDFDDDDDVDDNKPVRNKEESVHNPRGSVEELGEPQSSELPS